MRSFRSRNPVPIGAVFIVLTLLAMYLSFNVGKISFVSGPTYKAAFSEAAGLRVGDKVRVGGVAVGQVSKVALAGSHVRVSFTLKDSSVHLGMESRASIQIFTLLGNKYLALEPKGEGRWPRDREIPLSQTTSPYDVEPAFQDLTKVAGDINVKQLADAFDTLSATFKDSPASVKAMLGGLGRLSETISSRDAELRELLSHASTFTAVLADRREQFVQLFGDGSTLLAMLRSRREVIDELLANTVALSRELTGLVHDNEKTLTPMLQHLHGVTSLIVANQQNLDDVIKGLYVFIRGEVDATGAGPWFDGTAINATNPFHAGLPVPTVRSTVPQSFGDLLGVDAARKALAGKR
jgi:phospholipid/cholesterol/gamma-HCH transport system substrate-binding protein